MSQYNFHYHPQDYPHNSYRQQQNPAQPAQTQTPGSNVVLPTVDTTTFIQSSREVRDLLTDAATLSDQLINTEIGRGIMEAAQKSDTEAIYRLLRAIGIKNNVHVSYTPHSFIITVTPPNQSSTLQTTVTLQMVWNKFF